MSELKGVYLNEYYSVIDEVRQYVNERIDQLKQRLDERKVQLNTEIDKIEKMTNSDDEKSKQLIENLLNYEKITVSLFGEQEFSPHLANIRTKIESLEKELSRKKIYLQWQDSIIVENVDWLGVVAYESSDVYVTIESQFKQISNSLANEQKEEDKDTVVIKEGDSEHTSKDCSLPVKAYPKIAKKPNIYGNRKEVSLYDDVIPSETNKEYVYLSELQTDDNDSECGPVYENLSQERDTTDEPDYSEIDPDDMDTDPYESCPFESEYDTAEPNPDTLRIMPVEEPNPDIIPNEPHSDGVRTLPRSRSVTRNLSVQPNILQTSRLHTELKLKRSNSVKLNEQPYVTIDETILVDLQAEHKVSKSRIESRYKPPPLDTEMKKWVRDLPVVEWGDQGKGIRKLYKPKGVCVSEKGNIFIAEKGNNRVQVFSDTGQHLYMFGKSGQNPMIEPNGIWVSTQFVYVTLTNLHTVHMYTLQGGFKKKKAKEGKEEGKFKLPLGICGDSLRGKLFICDTGNNRVQIFDTNLHFLSVMKTTTPLYRPLDIKVLNMGNLIVVLDRSYKCIHMFRASGESIRNMIELQSFPKLVNPLYFTVDKQGNILLSDYSSNCIHIFTEQGDLLWILGEAGAGKPFIQPRGIAFDNMGRLVTVCHKEKAQVQIFEVYNFITCLI